MTDDKVRARLGQFVMDWKKSGEAVKAKWLTDASGLYFGRDLEQSVGIAQTAARLEVADMITQALNHTPHISGLEIVRSLRSQVILQLYNHSYTTSPSFEMMRMARLKATAEIVHRFCPA
jgi:hypothetical protein